MIFLRYRVVGLMKRYCCPQAFTFAKWSHGASLSLPGIATSSFHPGFSTSRFLATSSKLRKDAVQPEEMQKGQELDLDIWKSVMRSQGSQDEKPKGEEEEADLKEEEGELSGLEASRILVEMWRQAGKMVPEQMTYDELKALAELTTKSSKRKYLKFLAVKEGHKRARKEKKEKKKAAKETDEAARVDGESEGEEEGEDKLKNTFLLRIWTRTMDKAMGWRVAQAMVHGQPLVYDMSYDQHMTRREMENSISQMLETEGWNRRSVDPFHLHFCNLQPNGTYHRELLKRYGQEAWDRLLITTTSQRHVDFFPHEKLVYLTADSPNVLRHFDHNKVYIVGAMVDRSIQSGVSLANAKRLKLATARLPLDEYLHWDSGAKNLTLDQMIRILLTVKETGSWQKALEFVPKRKHDGFYQRTTEDKNPCYRPFKASIPRDTHRDSVGEGSQIFLSKRRQRRPPGGNANPASSFQAESTTSGQARLRTALKSKIEERKKVMNRRNWWED